MVDGVSVNAARFLLPLIYLGFVSLGLPDGTLGVAWPQMHGALGLPVGLAGVLLLVVTLLSAGSSFASGAVLRRFRVGPVVAVSCVMTGSAMLLVAESRHLGWLLLAAVPLGLGAGSVDAGLNGYVARHYSGRHMSWLHACWGVGATTGPLIMAAALGSAGGWRTGYLTIGTVQLGLAVVFVLTLRLWTAVPERTEAPVGGGGATAGGPTRGANSEAAWLSAGIFAIYVGVETMMGLWLGTILVQGRGVAPEVAGLCATVYYGTITAGRVLTGVVVDRWGNRRVVRAGVVLAVVGAALFLLPAGPGVAAVALALLGLGFAPIYPGLMHEVPRRFAPAAVQTVIGRQSGASYLGGALFPALAGGLAQVGSPGAVAGAGVGLCLLMVAAIWRLDRLT